VWVHGEGRVGGCSTLGEQDLITLLDENGVEHEFSLVDILDVDQRRYAVLQPVVEGEESEAAVIFRLEEDDTLITIEDDAEFERVRQAFEAAEASEEAAEDQAGDQPAADHTVGAREGSAGGQGEPSH
jgi:uncharacterized protein YrzB (UPF0473 family)